MPKVAVNVRQLTAQPSSSFVRPNSGSRNLTTPDITEASKPIKKPPNATIKLMNTICDLFFTYLKFNEVNYF